MIGDEIVREVRQIMKEGFARIDALREPLPGPEPDWFQPTLPGLEEAGK